MAATPAPSERTLIEVLRLSTDYLAQHGSTSPRLDAELLLAHALGVRRLDLYLLYDRPVREPELGATRELIRRRASGEPVAYITGVREFYNRAFAVTPAVLIPRPETETLVEVALRRLGELSDGGVPTAADLGTGSGCIAVALAAELPALHLIATDASSALAVARSNAVAHAVDQRVTFLEGDWARPLTTPVDVVVSNPPYVTTEELAATARDVRDFEPRLALDGGADGLDAYRALLASVHGATRPGSTVLLEIDPRRAGVVADLVRSEFAGARISFHEDLTRRDRVLEARLP